MGVTHGTIRLVGGRYELVRVVGSGGSGAVHLAHDRVLRRDVALKLLRPGYDEMARQRLRAEARIAASLGHPGIARVLDFGEETLDGQVAPYLVMEYVAGPTLRDVLRDGTHLTPARVLRLLADVGDALAAAHAAGVVHRDVKPGNIVLTPEGRAVLLDFGIARRADEEPLTMTGTIVGTLDYLSPEQASGASATPHSDLFALGMVAYEALTGLRPLSRDTQVATLMAHAHESVPPLPGSVPAGLRALVMAMVDRDPRRRPAGAGPVADRARELLRPSAVDRPAAAAPRRWWHRPWTASAAAVAILALAGVLVLAGRPGGGTTPVGATAPSTSAHPASTASTASTAADSGSTAPHHRTATPASTAPAAAVSPRPHAVRHAAPPPVPHAGPKHPHPPHGHGPKPGHGHGHAPKPKG